MVSTTYPFLICRETSYKLHELTPAVLMEASRSFAKFPPRVRANPDAFDA